jgi:hypothetical protein
MQSVQRARPAQPTPVLAARTPATGKKTDRRLSDSTVLRLYQCYGFISFQISNWRIEQAYYREFTLISFHLSYLHVEFSTTARKLRKRDQHRATSIWSTSNFAKLDFKITTPTFKN